MANLNLTIGKLIFLCLISVALCSFGPMSIFAPIPLSMAMLLYGYYRSITVAIIWALIIFALSFKVSSMGVLALLYVLGIIFSLTITQIILKNIHPIRGLIVVGSGFIVVSLIVFGIYTAMGGKSLESIINENIISSFEILKQNQKQLSDTGEHSEMINQILENPKDLTKKIIQYIPAILFVGVFINLWISLFVVLKNALIWRFKIDYKYSLRDLINFKVNDYFIWPLIVALTLLVFGNYIPFIDYAEVIGGNIIYCLGVFYFFQGFGIFVDFLNYVNIYGFIRTIIVMLTLLTAIKYIALVGIFDTWVNFRRFFKRKRGEKL